MFWTISQVTINLTTLKYLIVQTVISRVEAPSPRLPSRWFIHALCVCESFERSSKHVQQRCAQLTHFFLSSCFLEQLYTTAAV